MRVRLLLATLAAAAIAVPAGAAHAAIACTPKTMPTGAWVCVEVSTVPGGATTATSVTVDVNGSPTAWCIDRVTVTTGGVQHDPQTIHPCY
jgi:hypothetical protein